MPAGFASGLCNMFRISSIVFLLLALTPTAFSQQTSGSDSLSAETVKMDTVRRHSVKRAVIQSAVVPGWGQVYNKKWWKVPIIYAGFGGLGFAIGWNAEKFRTYSDAYRARVDGDSATVDQYVGVYSADNLVVLKNYYKRNMNLAIIFTGVLYALNMIDAAVDAHLFEYDISDDLTLRVQPVMQLSGSKTTNYTGLTMKMSF
jgi:hypothetical protein